MLTNDELERAAELLADGVPVSKIRPLEVKCVRLDIPIFEGTYADGCPAFGKEFIELDWWIPEIPGYRFGYGPQSRVLAWRKVGK